MPRFRVTVHNRAGDHVGEHVLVASDVEDALVQWKELCLALIKEKPKVGQLMGLTSTDLADIRAELETFTWAAREI